MNDPLQLLRQELCSYPFIIHKKTALTTRCRLESRIYGVEGEGKGDGWVGRGGRRVGGEKERKDWGACKCCWVFYKSLGPTKRGREGGGRGRAETMFPRFEPAAAFNSECPTPHATTPHHPHQPHHTTPPTPQHTGHHTFPHHTTQNTRPKHRLTLHTTPHHTPRTIPHTTPHRTAPHHTTLAV